MRQNEKRRKDNKTQRSYLRTVIKRFTALEDAAAVSEEWPGVVSTIDRMAQKRIIHHRTAARMKSRLARRTHGS
jgi:small subunit ribosomal protein S20